MIALLLVAQFEIVGGSAREEHMLFDAGKTFSRVTVTAKVTAGTLVVSKHAKFAEARLNGAAVTLVEPATGAVFAQSDRRAEIAAGALSITYYRAGDAVPEGVDVVWHDDDAWLPRGMQAYAKVYAIMREHGDWEDVAALLGSEDSTGVLAQIRSRFPGACVPEPKEIAGPHDPTATWFGDFWWSEPGDYCPWWKTRIKRLWTRGALP